MAKSSVLPFLCRLASSMLPIGNSLRAGLFAEPCPGAARERAGCCGPGGVLAVEQTVMGRASALALFGPRLRKSPKIPRSLRVSSVEETTALRQKLRVEDRGCNIGSNVCRRLQW